MTKRYLKTPEAVMQALREGKTVKNEHGYTYELKDAFIVQTFRGKIRSINTAIFFDEDYHVNEPEPLKLEVGKFYKTRDGRKALVYGKYKETNQVYPYTIVVVGEPMSETCVSKAGEVVVGAENIEDIVAPWEE